jgi:hypothetical protein
MWWAVQRVCGLGVLRCEDAAVAAGGCPPLLLLMCRSMQALGVLRYIALTPPALETRLRATARSTRQC